MKPKWILMKKRKERGLLKKNKSQKRNTELCLKKLTINLMTIMEKKMKTPKAKTKNLMKMTINKNKCLINRTLSINKFMPQSSKMVGEIKAMVVS